MMRMLSSTTFLALAFVVSIAATIIAIGEVTHAATAAPGSIVGVVWATVGAVGIVATLAGLLMRISRVHVRAAFADLRLELATIRSEVHDVRHKLTNAFNRCPCVARPRRHEHNEPPPHEEDDE